MTDTKELLDAQQLAQVSGGCNGGVPIQIAGTAAHEIIQGTGVSDAIDGRGGNDFINAGGGNDLVDGGDGKDVISGGAGDDVLHGGAGDDILIWTPGDGDDDLRGGAGQDTLYIHGLPGSREEILAMIVVEEGSPLPVIRDGEIDLSGVRGSLTIGEERITFQGLERLVLNVW